MKSNLFAMIADKIERQNRGAGNGLPEVRYYFDEGSGFIGTVKAADYAEKMLGLMGTTEDLNIRKHNKMVEKNAILTKALEAYGFIVIYAGIRVNSGYL